MKLSIFLLLIFLNINITSVLGEYRSMLLQIGECKDIVKSEIGECIKLQCNIEDKEESSGSIKVKYVTGKLYQLYKYTDSNCKNGLDYSYFNCSTTPLGDITTGVAVNIVSSKVPSIDTDSNTLKSYCYNEMDHSFNEDEITGIINGVLNKVTSITGVIPNLANSNEPDYTAAAFSNYDSIYNFKYMIYTICVMLLF